MSSTAAFTICSNNYLPRALTLAASLHRHVPAWSFYIGLVDTPLAAGQVEIPGNVTVIPASALNLPELDGMVVRYPIVELCTALKPSFFRTIFGEHPEIDRLHYLDPDTVVFSDLAPLETGLGMSAVQLTPHHLTPIPLDGLFPGEPLVLNHGIYNLGYLGLRRSPTTTQLLTWWEERMREHCVTDLAEGLFVDQLWFNLVPLYFPEVHVLRHPGANVAFWNLHERTLTDERQVLFEGARHALLFFHFSGFSPQNADRITRVAVRQDVEQQPALAALLREYRGRLQQNGWAELHAIESTYTRRRRQHEAALTREYNRRHPWRALVRRARAAVPERVKAVLRP